MLSYRVTATNWRQDEDGVIDSFEVSKKFDFHTTNPERGFALAYRYMGYYMSEKFNFAPNIGYSIDEIKSVEVLDIEDYENK